MEELLGVTQAENIKGWKNDFLLYEAILEASIRYYWLRDKPRKYFLVFTGKFKRFNNTFYIAITSCHL